MNDVARDGELDLGAVGRALSRKKWWVFGPALAVAALTFVGVNLIAPKYKSEARIIIEGRENVFFRPDAEKNTERDRTVDQEAITSQVLFTGSPRLWATAPIENAAAKAIAAHRTRPSILPIANVKNTRPGAGPARSAFRLAGEPY